MGMGIGDWAQSPIPNPQSPIPNPQSPIPMLKYLVKLKNNLKINFLNNYLNKLDLNIYHNK